MSGAQYPANGMAATSLMMANEGYELFMEQDLTRIFLGVVDCICIIVYSSHQYCILLCEVSSRVSKLSLDSEPSAISSLK